MSRWSEREIARKLAERDELEPPPGLLEKIKSEIPPMIPAGTGVPEIDRRPSMPPRQRWLMAASLVAMLGAGLFALRVRMEVPPVEETARTVVGARRVEKPVTPPPPPAKPAPELRAFQRQPVEAPEAKPQLPRREQEALKSLGYVNSQDEKKGKAGREAPEGVVGGLAGDEPAAPPPVPSLVPPPPAQAAPLLDERRAEKKEKDRINVGGNEAGQQSLYKGPATGAAAPPAPAPQALAKAARDDSGWQVPTSRILDVKTDAGTASYDLVRRSLAAGRLPDPAEVRVGEIVNAFDTGDALRVEGAITPFVHGPRCWLLRIHMVEGRQAQLSFNAATVTRYRLVGVGLSTLYEIELRPGVPSDAQVATLHRGVDRNVEVLELVPWDQASPGFRLAALAAEFAEILKASPVDSSALHRLSAEIGKLPQSAKASELGDLVEKAARASMLGLR
jgi:von Willebrand factor